MRRLPFEHRVDGEQVVGVGRGLCRTIDGVDLSEEAFEVARNEARAEGPGDRMAYRQADPFSSG